MNPAAESLLEKLAEEMEEEIFYYHLLMGEIKKESELLRKGSNDALLESLHSLEIYTTEIRKIHQTIQKRIEKLLVLLGGGEGTGGLSRLLTLLPSGEAQKVKEYRKTLSHLKNAIAQINNRNQNYIQQSLVCWREMFSLLVQPLAESPVYLQNGTAHSSARPPISLNRRV